MSYLLKARGQQPGKGGPPPGQRRYNNPTISSVQRRPVVGGGSSGQSRNPTRNGASAHPNPHHQDEGMHDVGAANNQQRRHNVPGGGVVVNDGGGQVQLQRMAPNQHRQLQQQQQHTNAIPQNQIHQNPIQQQQQKQAVQGLVSMDEVYADLQILEQQRQESERKLASTRLLQKQKKAEQCMQESKLCELKSQVGGLRVELQRFNSQLSLRHRELLEIQMKAENSRKDTHRFDAKLKRVIGVARSLGTYRNKINNALIMLNETETRLNFTKGQELSKLRSSRLRRDDVRHRRGLLLKAIHANNVKARSIAEDVSKTRAETVMIEQDLSEAQQTESQTKLRVETIEHEVMLERTRHTEVMTNIESKSTELDESKDKIIQSIANKKALIEAKKAELRAMWEQCNQLRKSEDHDVFPEPKWGSEQPPSLDVARIRVRVNGEEADLNAMKSKRDTLLQEGADFDALIETNAVDAAENRAKAESLQTEAEKVLTAESVRKTEIAEAVKAAELECQEVEKLRNSIKDLTVAQEKDAADMKLQLENDKQSVSAMEAEIARSMDELALIKTQCAEHKEKVNVIHNKLHKEFVGAKTTADMVKTAYERAQKNAKNFKTLDDDGNLVLQMKLLDESEQQIVDDANRERDEIIQSEPLLAKLMLDFNSDVTLEEQKEAGMKYLRKHCRSIIETAKVERQVRIEHARDALLEEERLREEEDLRRKKEDKLQEESRFAEEALLREEEEEEQEEMRRKRIEDERAATNKQKKAEAKRREEQRAADFQRKQEKEDKARRRRREEEAASLNDYELHREEQRAASLAAAKDKQKREETKRREELRAATKTADSRSSEKSVIAAADLQRTKKNDEANKAQRRQNKESKKALELENMRHRTKEVSKQLRDEETKNEDRKRKEQTKQRADRKRHEELQSRKSSLELMDDAGFMDQKIRDDAKYRDRKSYSKVEDLKLKSDKLHEKRVRDDTMDGEKNKRAKASSTKSAIKLKNPKLPKSTQASVRFDTTADARPKLDIFTSVVQSKDRKKTKASKSSSSKLSQSSGISSCEGAGGGRRRKKPQFSKSKASVLAMKGFEDSGAFL